MLIFAHATDCPVKTTTARNEDIYNYDSLDIESMRRAFVELCLMQDSGLQSTLVSGLLCVSKGLEAFNTLMQKFHTTVDVFLIVMEIRSLESVEFLASLLQSFSCPANRVHLVTFLGDGPCNPAARHSQGDQHVLDAQQHHRRRRSDCQRCKADEGLVLRKVDGLNRRS